MQQSQSFGKRPRAGPPPPIRRGYDKRPWSAAFNPARALANDAEEIEGVQLGAVAAACLVVLVLLGAAIVPMTEGPFVSIALKGGCAAILAFAGWRAYLVQSPWASGLILLSAFTDLLCRIALPGAFVQQYAGDLLVALALCLLAGASLRGAMALQRRRSPAPARR